MSEAALQRLGRRSQAESVKAAFGERPLTNYAQALRTYHQWVIDACFQHNTLSGCLSEIPRSIPHLTRFREVPSGMTCKLLALAIVASHLAWSTLTLVGVESASAQTTPSPSSTPSPSPSTAPTPTPESTLSLATLASGPDVVITYEGALVEFARYQSGGCYVVEIPEERRSRLIRGDLSACASKNGVTVWSFPNRPGTQAILRHAAGRIEITFAPDLQLFSATPPKVERPLIDGPIKPLIDGKKSPPPRAVPSSVPPKAEHPVIEKPIKKLSPANERGGTSPENLGSKSNPSEH